MNETLYYFPEQLKALAHTSGIDKVSTAITEGRTKKYEEIDSPYFSIGLAHDLDSDEYIDEYIKKSALYERLTPEEQYTVQAIAVREKPVWKIKGEGTDSTDRLFPVEKQLGTIACGEMDIVTLSGAGSYAFEEAKFTRVFDKFTEFGFNNRLEFMIFAGAWFGNKVQESIGYPTSLEAQALPDGLIRQIKLGGDVHGDFRLARISTSEKGAIGPTNLHVGFSPFIREQVAAYHSTEQTIVTAIGAHLLRIDIPLEDKIELLQELLENQPQFDKEHGQSFYADFGTNNKDGLWEMALDLSLMMGREARLASLLVNPIDHSLTLDLESHPDVFIMRNNYRDQPIEFKTHELRDLLHSFLRIGNTETRTSGASIRNVLSVISLVLETMKSNADVSVSVAQVCEQVAEALSKRDI